MPEIEVNANVTRKPSFGWGNSDDLRKFLQQHQEKHNPLIWSVPQPATPSDFMGIYQRTAELNLCVVESNQDLLNEIRLDPGRSFNKVLVPMWYELRRRIALSDISMVDDVPGIELIPNYKVGDQFEGQYVWDVLKLTFTVNYSIGVEPINI